MSDPEASPSQNRSRDTLHVDDFNNQGREPKCINSLCNLINSRLKVLENEIVSQHKVWESIQREVDEVKSLIEDCTSTCGSSSSSAQENESENVDSAVESHKTCNSLYWGKIKQAEENVEEKKLLMRRLSNDVTKLKNCKKKCNRKHTKPKSSIDLILEVTNGLHVLKCDDCKFCSDHLDFREGLLSAVIELIHFTEKNYSHSSEENKALKSCLHKIHVKTRSCLLHSQIYTKSTQLHPFDTENQTVCVDSIYTTFEEFCHHFQNLQDELVQLRQILLAAEENHLDELFQDSHSANCICYNFLKKGDGLSSHNSDKIEGESLKGSQKNVCGYEKRIKSLTYCGEPDDDVLYDSDHIFKLSENDTKKQLEKLRTQIYEAVRTIRDVEVEENSDFNLVNMVTSLAEECSALRQEVSYLRNVRQEKKRSWNKLQCFIMDAERKLKGNRSTTEIKEVISDLGQIISSSSESSSLDETILYMYSNQLEWMEKNSTVSESKSDNAEANPDADLRYRNMQVDVYTQTFLRVPTLENNVAHYNHAWDTSDKCDIGIQVEDVFDFYTMQNSKTFETPFTEINREIYVVPEVMDENDSCTSSLALDSLSEPNIQVPCEELNIQVPCEEPNIQFSCEELNIQVPCEEPNIQVSCEEQKEENISSDDIQNLPSDLASNCDSVDNTCLSLLPYSNVSGTFNFETNFNEHKLLKTLKNFTLPLLNMSDISYNSNKSAFGDLFSDQTYPFNSLFDKNLYIYLFLNHGTDISHKFNNMLFNVKQNNSTLVEISDEEENWKCVILKNQNSPIPLNSSKSLKCLPFQTSISEDPYVDGEEINNSDIVEEEIIYPETVLNSSAIPIPISSSTDGEHSHMPKEDSSVITNSDENTLSTESRIEDIENQIITDSDENIQENSNETNCTDKKGSSEGDRPAMPCREGTFIVESAQSLGLRKPTVLDENMFYTAILTTLVSSSINSPDKSYVLFEICNSLKHTAAELNCEEIGTNLAETHNVQHFVLCESGFEDKTKSQSSIVDICHIIFCKSNANLENKGLFDISSGNNTSFNPLVPQYLPLETFNYESFETLSLTHNCEIYMCNAKNDVKSNNEDENSMFIPKNFLKFKASLPTTDVLHYDVLENSSQLNLLDNSMSYIKTEYSDTYALKTVEMDVEENFEMLNEHENNVTNEKVPEKRSMWSQTDESYKLVLQQHMAEIAKEKGEMQNAAVELEDEAEQIDNIYDIDDLENDPDMPNLNRAQSDHALKENGYLDEIVALKENLGHQNAVLQRLKEELEDSNLKLEEKESRLQMLQMEHTRLNEIILKSNIKEVDDKKCQTESSQLEQRVSLQKEIDSLRKENSENREKIVNQNKTIQHVKAQLCSSISHLKTLKDSAAKQLKKQKHQKLKALKMNEVYQEMKVTLEKKCEEIQRKNELISDQEFQLHEIQSRLDASLEELQSKKSQNTSGVTITVESETQTDVNSDIDFKRKKKSGPVTEQDVMLKKHSEELLELQTKLQHLESIFSNKKEYGRLSYDDNLKTGNDLKVPSHLKEGNIWKLLMISEQSYLSLLGKLSDSLQLSDLKGTVTLMHTSWINCEELADARRQDHKKILQSLDKLKRSIRYLQETHHQEHRRQNVESASSDEKKSGIMCHSDEMHFQYLCEVLQKAQENLVKEYSQKKGSQQRSVVSSTGSVKTSRHGNSRERRIPLELKNGRILALLDDKVNHNNLLPSKHEFTKMEPKAGTMFKSKSSS